MNKPKLEEYGCGDIIIRYKNSYTYFRKDQLRERITILIDLLNSMKYKQNEDIFGNKSYERGFDRAINIAINWIKYYNKEILKE
jgi:hypothetical protein